MSDPDELEEIREVEAEREGETLGLALGRFGEWKEKFTIGTGGDVAKRLYTPDDTDMDYDEDVDLPGEKSYVRGVYPTICHGQLWTMWQYAGFGIIAGTNKRFHYLIDNGSSGLSLAFGPPVQMGHNPDTMMAAGEVGKSGVAIDSLHDMEMMFSGINLDRASTSMTINALMVVLLAMYVALSDKQSVPRGKLCGTIQNDIMKECIVRNLCISPPESSMRLITDIFEPCTAETPKFDTISISGYHIREAESVVAQEVAFTLGNGVQYIEAAVDASLDVDDFAPQLSFLFNAHNNILEEVAKFRATRWMWTKIMEERFSAENPRSIQLKFYTQTGGSTLTAQQVENNVVRVAYQALAAVLGGTQSLHTNGGDEALSPPVEKSVRTTLRTQQILAHESGTVGTTDPLAGSYYVEALTDDIKDEALDLLDEVDERSGMLGIVKNQRVQWGIQNVAYERQREIERDKRIIIGVNEYQVDGEPTVEVQKASEEEERKQIESFSTRKDDRDEEAVEAALKDIRAAANDDENFLPLTVTAVKACVTVGETCDIPREEFGKYEPSMARAAPILPDDQCRRPPRTPRPMPAGH